VKSLSRIAALTLLFLKPAVRQPIVSLLVILLPVAFITVFHVIGGSRLSQHALYGTLVVFASNTGVVSLPQLALSHRTRRLRDMMIASPVGPASYATGLGLSRLAWSAPGLVAILVLLTWNGAMPISSVPAVLAVIAATWFTGVGIGFALAGAGSDIFVVGQIANIAGLVFTVIPPVYYPLEMLPVPWQWVAMIVPTTHAAQLIRVAGGVATTTGAMLALHWTVLLLWVAAAGFTVMRTSQWQER